ncbi:flagellar basal body rod protein FlgB [Pseudalkalibacillus caeni]|uniref:Flagellar basal body rod protein FlgB n=1 Tax=Exobacillus caeni TaxID=2574798 RepID=A0A5R9EZH3_9BACL|nr:flagellar basal body rod protein FlgB [Pseudalkalibacillus caeni]TLS36627.1 flagellar basal body rod protein FlgB [Pseudalkalibacillus caeni]
MKVFSTFQPLEQAINASSLRQKTITSNIANVDTPNYKAKKVSFQEELENVTNSFKSFKTNPKHVAFSTESPSTGHLKVETNKNTLHKSNGNNVDMDYEMAELAKNQLWYNALIDRTNGKFNNLKMVLNEGR